MANVNSRIKKATKATTTKVGTTYNPGAYAAQNPKVNATANQNAAKATANAESAYKLAESNNASRAAQSHATNAVTTRQIGNRMRRDNYSLTNRNVAGAATARSASGINAAQTNANRNAAMTKERSINKARQSIHTSAAKMSAGNIEKDIARSTERSKTKAQQAYQSAEKKKSRDLKNAIADRERSYAKHQRQLKSYTSTVSVRYQSVKAVDKAIKKLRKSNTKDKSTKLAYLEALRAKLLNEKKKGGSGRGRRGYGRGYGGYGRGYGYGSGNGGDNSGMPELPEEDSPFARIGKGLKKIGNAVVNNLKKSGAGKSGSNKSGSGKSGSNKSGSNKKKSFTNDTTALWANRGRHIAGKDEKRADRQAKKAKNNKKKRTFGTNSATRATWKF